jgi:hypothetical protein
MFCHVLRHAFAQGAPMAAESEHGSTGSTYHDGGTEFYAGHDINIGGDVVGRDKVVQYINSIQDPQLKRAYCIAEMSQIKVYIDGLQDDRDGLRQQLHDSSLERVKS